MSLRATGSSHLTEVFLNQVEFLKNKTFFTV